MPWSSSDRRSRLPSNWDALRRRILKRDGWLCQLRDEGCTGLATEVDHIGADTDHRPESLRSACAPCHAKRTSRQATEARARIAGQRFRPVESHPGLI